MADAELDKARNGPRWREDERIAMIVVQTLRKGAEELKQYALHSFVVMPNHVHILIEPKISAARIMKGIKGVSARRANEILGRTNQNFWRDESYDHWVRSEAEFKSIKLYIEHNPVTAGLVERPEDWPWSSASARFW